MTLTLIAHLWNEEFLLPYWLRHHVPLFDRGILLDYGSTDRSAAIIQELAPHWEVRPSRNAWFDAEEVDREVMEVEREAPGWKVVLNLTEFLLCPDLRLFVRWLEKYRADLQGLWAYDLTMVDRPAERDDALTEAPLYFQKRWGYHAGGGRSRLLHRCPDGRYDTGRHTSGVAGKAPDDSLFLLWFSWCPIRAVAGRKLQIQQRIPQRDRLRGLGRQHLLTPESLEAAYQAEAAKAYDLWERHPAYRELIEFMARQAGYPLPGGAPAAGDAPAAPG
jgi:hypothetical protein